MGTVPRPYEGIPPRALEGKPPPSHDPGREREGDQAPVREVKDITYAELRENLFAWVQQNATGAVGMHIGSMSAGDVALRKLAEANRYVMLALGELQRDQPAQGQV